MNPNAQEKKKQSIYSLIYLSKATSKFKETMLEEIIKKSQNNNEKLQVGGCLIYENGLFLQILEGEHEKVEKVFKIIEKDDRHDSITILKRATTSHRSYPNWRMKNITKTEESQIFSAMNHLLSSLSDVYLILERYTHPKIRKIISAGLDPSEVKPVLEKKAVLICDLVKFTDFTNILKPELHSQILNEFLGIISSLTLSNSGNVVSFTGDCVFSEFDKASDALNAAISMLEKINLLDAKYKEVPLNIGIGLSYGEVRSGSFGSVHHAQYTMYSSTVNKASRLEGVTRDYNHHMVFDDSFYNEVVKSREKDTFQFLGKVALKGFNSRIPIYTIDHPMNIKKTLEQE